MYTSLTHSFNVFLARSIILLAIAGLTLAAVAIPRIAFTLPALTKLMDRSIPPPPPEPPPPDEEPAGPAEETFGSKGHRKKTSPPPTGAWPRLRILISKGEDNDVEGGKN